MRRVPSADLLQMQPEASTLAKKRVNCSTDYCHAALQAASSVKFNRSNQSEERGVSTQVQSTGTITRLESHECEPMFTTRQSTCWLVYLPQPGRTAAWGASPLLLSNNHELLLCQIEYCRWSQKRGHNVKPVKFYFPKFVPVHLFIREGKQR